MSLNKPAIFLSGAVIALFRMSPAFALPLSPGDRLRLFIPADSDLPEAQRISGLYEVNLDGTLQFPFLDPIPAAGLELPEVEQQVSRTLVEKGLFRANGLRVSIKVFQWAPVQVNVSGATFEPGRVLINSQPTNSTSGNLVSIPTPIAGTIPVSGNYPPERYLTAAIRTAGGVTPDADIKNIRLVRNNQTQVIDLSGVFSGESERDVPLVAGDQVIVPRLDKIQNDLVRPSQLTPSVIPIFVSNATAPGATGTTDRATELAYGTRFSNAVVSSRCVGGNLSTSGKRRVTLMQTNRTTGKTTVIDQPVETLLRNSTDNTNNPFLMPRDGIVCYDSKNENTSGILRFITDILNPFNIIRGIFR